MSHEEPNPVRSTLTRRRLLAFSGAAIGAAVMSPLLAACGSDDEEDDEPAATTDGGSGAATTTSGGATAPTGGAATATTGGSGGEARQGGTVTVGSIQEPDNINPWMTGAVVGFEVFNMIYDPLTRVGPDGSHVPVLATDVPSVENGGISEDLQTYTYVLREGITWHDGTPFTADDVIFTYEAIKNPAVNVPGRLFFDLIETVEAPDPQTVVFNLNKPSGVFLEAFGYRGILPKHLFDGQDLNTTELNRAPKAGTGAYKFVEWVSGDRIVVERNENYYREGANLDQIIYRIVPNSDTLLTMLETGEIDMRFTMTAEHVPIVREYEDYTVFESPAHSYFHFTINGTDPVLGDKLVRQALTYGLDKNQITDTVLKGLVEPHWSPVAKPSWAYVEPETKMEFDADRAEELLQEAGYTKSGDFYEKDGERLTLKLMTIAGDTERLQVVQLAQASWKEIGVDATLDPVDLATFVTKSTSDDFQIAYGFWSYNVDPSGYNDRYLSTSPSNWTDFKIPEADQLLLDSMVTVDQEERKANYARFQEIAIEEAPNIWVYNRIFFDAVKNRVKGFAPNPSNSTNMWNVNEWWVEED